MILSTVASSQLRFYMVRKFSATNVAALLAVAPVLAQETVQDSPEEAENVMILEEWNYDPLYTDGWSVEDFLQRTTVVNPAGEAIGDIVNVIFHDNGGLVAVVAEVGGFLGVGETLVRIPWDEVRLADDLTQLEAPISEERVGDYPVLADPETRSEPAPGLEDATVVGDEAPHAEAEFSATDLIGDDAYFADDQPHGSVNDIIVAGDAIAAVVIEAEAGAGGDYYAYPYNETGQGRPHYGPRHDLPRQAEDRMIDAFDYDRLRRPSK